MSIQAAVATAMAKAIESSMDPMAPISRQFMESQMTSVGAAALQSKLDTMERLERKIEDLKERQADGRTIEVYQSMLESYSGSAWH